MNIVTLKTSRPGLVEQVGDRRYGALPLRRWWQTLGVATTFLCVATMGSAAATFTLSNGDIIEGEIVQATRNTLVIRERVGGMRQLSRNQMESMRVETKKGQTISGPLISWQDGTYEIEYGGRLVQVRERRIVSVAPIPPEQAIAETETETDTEPETAENSVSSDSPTAAAEDTAPQSEPLSSASATVVVVAPPAKLDGSASAEAENAPPEKLDGAASAEAENAPPPKPTELATASVDSETSTPIPSDPEALRMKMPFRRPKLTVTEVQAGENASELVFKLDLSRPVDRPIMILYATYDKTAVAGEDYKGERGTMTLAPGTSSAVCAYTSDRRRYPGGERNARVVRGYR